MCSFLTFIKPERPPNTVRVEIRKKKQLFTAFVSLLVPKTLPRALFVFKSVFHTAFADKTCDFW